MESVLCFIHAEWESSNDLNDSQFVRETLLLTVFKLEGSLASKWLSSNASTCMQQAI